MSGSSAFNFRTTPAPCEQRPEWLLLEMKQKLDDLIYKEQVNQLWKLGMESMMHSVWAKVCTQYSAVSVSCQTDEQVKQVCDTSSGKCPTGLHGSVTCLPEEESAFGFGTEEDSEQTSEGNPAKRSLEVNFFSRVNEGDVCDVSVPVGSFSVAEDGSSPPVLADVCQEERSEPDRGSRSENVKSYPRARCESKFSRKDAYSRHQRSYQKPGERRKKCPLCLRVFVNQNGLTRHTKGSACQGKPVQSHLECLQCATSFNTKALFYRHLLCHKEKKLVCTACDKAFHFQSELNVHMTYHSDEKPYRCRVCSIGFTHQHYLYRHVREQHPK